MTTAPYSGICPAHLTVILSIFCPTCCLSGCNSQPMVCSIKSSPFLQKDPSRSVPLPPGTRRHLELSLPELIEIQPIDLIISHITVKSLPRKLQLINGNAHVSFLSFIIRMDDDVEMRYENMKSKKRAPSSII
ncbi:hypothetical protein EJB05_24195 [Eragrostis curvula]|uniref:Uncharacterized protein n=1 Tax=Eragrostis curvula TaxID=38414 RepID=A0A5J9VAD6_9POAL|nr:hypothetical protein EJB05_24195 [Eragrostis curvula]